MLIHVNFFLAMSPHSQIIAINVVRAMVLLAIGIVAKITKIRPKLYETRNSLSGTNVIYECKIISSMSVLICTQLATSTDY